MPNVIWIIMALVLVGSSLALRRLPRQGLVKLVLIWIAIFGLLWLGVWYWMTCCAVRS